MEDKSYPSVPLTKIQPMKFRVYSHNIKNGGHTDLVPGEQPWEHRVDDITASIKFHRSQNSIVTLQEVYKFQLDSIVDALNKVGEWDWYGVGRIDGKEMGEFVPILFRTSEWELVFSDTVWLNDKDPRTALEGWDAKYLRIVSYVTLKNKHTGNHINVFNTHFDHVGQEARHGSAKAIIRRMEDINQWPSILCGDLNFEPEEDTYDILAQSLQDVSKLATDDTRYGYTDSSVTGFADEVLALGGQKIDYIFAPKYATSMNGQCKGTVRMSLEAWGVLQSKFGQYYMSDHRPLVADFWLDKCE
ncbi:DNase I-like protein [Suhomyces tanzawaensis NRRL Y-17324]|uniref:DNase I-like protein n=1 Tax=Suhomyces tanzawaensis NRRL Y-17324 TaxID=984487 RepID=A0A1E4SHP5_9ASCO|nr:DNase I-like protein [Suhomyces tanzawaensis NRRL Y-17324]ODV79015.1 DNase I-like protein [Suhomyces tanzawaensis NRRL Y-17324]